MAKFPVTDREDVLPEKGSFPKKKHQESFNQAMNPPNNPTKNKRPTAFNVTDDYCHDEETSENGSEDEY